jgi:hypothetical protein
VWPFKAKSILSAEDEEWQVETWGWLLEHLGGRADLQASALVTPTRDFFPPTEAKGHARAEHVFAHVKRHARMDDWECRLMVHGRRPDPRVNVITSVQGSLGGPAGTFTVEGNQVVITYDAAALDDPLALVATFAHELAHYLLAALPELPPGGEENLEFATDLATVYLGFGIFGANTAFRFAQYQDGLTQGWSMSRQGYLAPREWVFALAIFMVLRACRSKYS